MAYALYVLARAGRAPVGDLKYLADTRSTTSARRWRAPRWPRRWRCWATRRARRRRLRLGQRGPDDGVETTTNRGYRADYGSVLRDASAILALATEFKGQARNHQHGHVGHRGGARPYELCLDAGHVVDGSGGAGHRAARRRTSRSTTMAPRIAAPCNKTLHGQRTGEGRAHRQHRARMRSGPWSLSPARRMSQSPQRRTA